MAEQRNIAQLQRAENLLWIAGKPLFKAALDEWDRTDKLYTERADRLEKRSGDLKNEIYQLVSFFTVLQGVVLTAVTQMAAVDFQFSCKKVWGPALLAGLAWFATSVGVYLKLRSIQDFDDKRANQNRFHQVSSILHFSSVEALRMLLALECSKTPLGEITTYTVNVYSQQSEVAKLLV